MAAISRGELGGARLGTTLVFLVTGIGTGAWAASLPAFQSRLGLSEGALSIALLAFAAGAVLSMPVAGLLAPRLGTGRATRWLGLAFAAATLLPPLAGGLASLSVLALLLGAAMGATDVAMNAHASHVESRWDGAIMSSFHAAFSAGGLVGAGLGAGIAWLGGAEGWIMAGAGLLCLALVGAAWPRIGPGEAGGGGPAFRLPGRAALGLGAAAGACMVAEGAMADWSAVYLSTVAKASPPVAAAGYAVFSAAMVLGRLTGDRIVRALGPARVAAGGGALAALGYALAAATPELAIAGCALIGLGLSNIVPVLFSAAGRLGPSPATGIAMVATAGYAGFLLGPPVVGGIASVTGLRAAFILLALLAGAVAVMGARLRRA
ncbi:MFS transporter [Roseomonas sp. CCTCC AB2023176]|uniref:MFS transporter n=1 Tax=Roseomonas sp. CCTCC AB2023176 TaxID=3342640 RepID=UPI0035DE0E5D